MNWGGTKWILIVVFLILNLFLGYQLWQKTSHQPELANSYQSALDELLYLHQISLETELNPFEGALAPLEVSSTLKEGLDFPFAKDQQVRIEGNRIEAALMMPYKLEEPFDSRAFRENFLKKYVYQNEAYQLEGINSTTIRYVQYYKELPLFISKLDISVNPASRMVTGYEQLYFSVLREGTKQPIIPAEAALTTLIEQQVIPPFAAIRAVTLGYYGHPYEAQLQVLTPTWRIIFQTGTEIKESYVNAYTGAIELDPNQTDEVKQDEHAFFHFGQRQHGECHLYLHG